VVDHVSQQVQVVAHRFSGTGFGRRPS